MSLLKLSFRYLVFIVSSCYISLLILLVLVTPIRLIINTDQIQDVFFLIIFATSFAFISFYHYKQEGFKLAITDNYNHKQEILSVVISDVMYIILNLIINYNNPAIVPALSLGRLLLNIEYKSYGDLEYFRTISPSVLFISLSILTFINIPISAIGFYYGKMARIKSRHELITQSIEKTD